GGHALQLSQYALPTRLQFGPAEFALTQSLAAQPCSRKRHSGGDAVPSRLGSRVLHPPFPKGNEGRTTQLGITSPRPPELERLEDEGGDQHPGSPILTTQLSMAPLGPGAPC